MIEKEPYSLLDDDDIEGLHLNIARMPRTKSEEREKVGRIVYPAVTQAELSHARRVREKRDDRAQVVLLVLFWVGFLAFVWLLRTMGALGS